MRLIDSLAWVEFLRPKGDSRIKHQVARLLEADQAAYTCPIHFELLSGVRRNEENDLRQAFTMSHHFPFTPGDWLSAAAFERLWRSKGVIIPRNDLFVVTVPSDVKWRSCAAIRILTWPEKRSAKDLKSNNSDAASV